MLRTLKTWMVYDPETHASVSTWSKKTDALHACYRGCVVVKMTGTYVRKEKKATRR